MGYVDRFWYDELGNDKVNSAVAKADEIFKRTEEEKKTLTGRGFDSRREQR